LWVDSEVGVGSTFHFTAVLEVRAEPTEVPGPGSAEYVGDVPVVVVDDNATAGAVISEILSRWGMKVRTFDSGKALLAAYEGADQDMAAPALAIVDRVMPGMDGFELARHMKDHTVLTATRVIMLGAPGAPSALRHGAVSSYVTKPVAEFELRIAVERELNPSSGIGRDRHLPTIFKSERSYHVLVAEDNLVNREVASKMLEKMGHRVSLAHTGRQAVAAVERETFDLIFMDVQMPEMDGIQAVQAIRALERPLGRHTPIVAMTAHAMKGDRERFLSAGMDDYTAKPVKSVNVAEIIDRFLPVPSQLRNQELAGVQPDAHVLQAGILERFGGDSDIIGQIATVVREEFPRLIKELHLSIDEMDSEGLSRVAHRLKGSVGELGSRDALETAARLEALGMTGDLSNARESAAIMEKQVLELMAAVEGLTGPHDRAEEHAAS
ncbi:MAG: response regulator, partial [Pseudomonadota bacterium]